MNRFHGWTARHTAVAFDVVRIEHIVRQVP